MELYTEMGKRRLGRWLRPVLTDDKPWVCFSSGPKHTAFTFICGGWGGMGPWSGQPAVGRGGATPCRDPIQPAVFQES